MKYLFLAIYIFFITSCTSQVVLKKNEDNTNLVDEMMLRTKSWWGMCFIFVFASIVHPVVTYIGLAFLSFFTFIYSKIIY